MEKRVWGKTKDGADITVYTISNSNGMTVEVMDYGATILSINVPTKDGKVDVALGHKDLESYFTNSSYIGAWVVRHANRIGGANFELNGKTYELEKNDGNNNLHSGSNALNIRMWNVDEAADNHVTFSYDSPAGDMGFPGKMHLTLTYTVLDDNSVALDAGALADEDTIFNPTTHCYFNLAGHDHGTILDHELYVNADSVTFADKESIPDGSIRPVTATPFDFRNYKLIGKEIEADYDMMIYGKGYDHNFVLNKDKESEAPQYSVHGLTLNLAAKLRDPASGHEMEVYTDLPGIQVYTCNFFNGTDIGKSGKPYPYRGATALETQYFPNAINVPSFDQPVVRANEQKYTRTVYKFLNF